MNFKAGDVVAVDFPGVSGIKRRPAIVLSTTSTPKLHRSTKSSHPKSSTT